MATLKYYDESTATYKPLPYGSTSTITTSEDKTYIHRQQSASSTWIVVHNLNKYPSVVVQDSGGSLVVGEIVYSSLNNLTLKFSAPFSGTAYLN